MADLAKTWTRTSRFERLGQPTTVYTNGDYRIEGKGHFGYGGKIVRTWTLFRGDVVLGNPTRLSEAKDRAAEDAAAK